MILELLFLTGAAVDLPRHQCRDTDSIGVRNGHAMAYDQDRKAVLLFGGADERQVRSDLWAWDGQKWRCTTDRGPSPRTFPGLAYDGARKQLVLFGGNRVLFGTGSGSDTFLNDMWIRDGQGWSEFTGERPEARAEPAMVFDCGRNRIVLFGGHRTVDGQRLRFGDTWEWDGSRWERRRTSGPAARNGAAMAFDAGRRRVVLFGGSGATGDTWEWNGEDWRQIDSADAPGRFNSVMAYDAHAQAIIRFGGWNGKSRLGDTWSYDGRQWRQMSTEGPTARNHSSMVYDTSRETIVLFGGHDGEYVFGDTWELSRGSWSLVGMHPPELRLDNGH